MIEATFIDHMGTDLTVANAARVSFGKQSEMDTSDVWGPPKLKDKDAKLIKYLAKHKHISLKASKLPDQYHSVIIDCGSTIRACSGHTPTSSRNSYSVIAISLKPLSDTVTLPALPCFLLRLRPRYVSGT